MSIKKYSISCDDNIYEAWPDLALADNGNLICIFTECAHHKDRSDSCIVYTISTDKGRTWSPKIPLTERGDKYNYYNCARISRMPDGKLAIICDYVVGEDESVGGKIHLWFSEDNGESWSGPVATSAVGIVPDKLMVLKSGRWLISAHHRDSSHKKLAQFVWHSDDEGKTWSEERVLASDQRYNLCEVSMLELPDSTVVAYLRENSKEGLPCFKSLSFDGGITWSSLYQTPIQGCHRPTSGFLSNGKILITYRYRPGSGGGWLGAWTHNLFAAIMLPESAKETESKKQALRVMPIDYDRSPVSDIGYSGWVQFPDGEIYVCNYLVDDAPTQKAQIRGYSFMPSDIMLEL